MKFLKFLLPWLAATVVAAAAGSVVQTQFNLAAIAGLGAPIPPALRLQTTLQDLAGFAPVFAAVAGAGLLLALPVAAWLVRRLPARRALLYTLAGAAAVAAAILLMNTLLPVTPIGATRSLAGFLALSACGALGGWTFAGLAPGGRRTMA